MGDGCLGDWAMGWRSKRGGELVMPRCSWKWKLFGLGWKRLPFQAAPLPSPNLSSSAAGAVTGKYWSTFENVVNTISSVKKYNSRFSDGSNNFKFN